MRGKTTKLWWSEEKQINLDENEEKKVKLGWAWEE